MAREVGVQVARGLVGQDQLRVDDHAAGDGHALLLAAGKLGTAGVGALLQVKGADNGAHALVDGHLGHPAHFQRDGDVLEHAALGQNLEVLEDHGDLAPKLRQLHPAQAHEVHARDVGRAALGPQIAVEHAQERGLARARRPGQKHEFAALHMQRDVFESLRSAQNAVHMFQMHHTSGVLTPNDCALEGGGKGLRAGTPAGCGRAGELSAPALWRKKRGGVARLFINSL